MWDPDIDDSSSENFVGIFPQRGRGRPRAQPYVVPNPPVVVPPAVVLQPSVSQSTSRVNPMTPQRSPPKPQPVLDQSYPLFINLEQRKGKIPPLAPYTGYGTGQQPKGSHIQFGRPQSHPLPNEPMGYPSLTPSQLGQSQSGYSDQHSEEYILPKDRAGRRAVYGTHQGLAIAGPAEWQQYFKKWFAVGQGFTGSAPSNEPLHPNEKTFCENHGIIFTHKLGEGGYGSVWGCTVTQKLSYAPRKDYTTYKLACKILSLRVFFEKDKSVEECFDQLVKEYYIHNKLEHQNIVRSEEVFFIHDDITGFPFNRLLHFMELCDGDIAHLMATKQNGRFTETEAHEWFIQVIEGLRYLHHKNVVHFDIKVTNIMYKTEVQRVVYKLADFGLAKVYKSGQAVEGLGERGTRLYFPPEMNTWVIQKPFPTKAVDIWCLCLALCESLGGRRNYNDLRHSVYNFEPGHTLELCNLVIMMSIDDPHQRITIDNVFQTQFVRFGPQNII